MSIFKKLKAFDNKLASHCLKKSQIIGLLVCIILAFVAIIGLLSSSDDKILSPTKTIKTIKTIKTTKMTEAQCRKNLRCWAKKNYQLTWQCRRLIKRQIDSPFIWDVDWYNVIFSHYKWLNEKQGTIIYMGDTLKIQNINGGWENYSYACHLDPNNEQVNQQVLNIRLIPGKLQY